jgi:hypothetical protein
MDFGTHKAVQPMLAHGLEINGESGSNLVGDCPFCGKENHFYVHPGTGLWDCKKCGEKGNVSQWLERHCAHWLERTSPSTYRELGRYRGVPWRAFKAAGMAWDGEKWLLPCRDITGAVVDVKTFRYGSKWFSTKGCHAALWGSERLPKVPEGGVVRLCEGHWDGPVMQWLLREAGSADVVVATSADIFKKDWVGWFGGKRVIMHGDADSAGDRFNETVGKTLYGTAQDVRFLNWPEVRPDGWDVSDQTMERLAAGDTPAQVLESLNALVAKHHRHLNQDPGGIPLAAVEGLDGEPGIEPEVEWKPLVLPPGQRPSFQKVVKTFRKWLKMDDDMVNGLRIILAVVLSEQLPGDPLWMYVIGPAGSGKTVLLSSTFASDRTISRSTIEPHGLISGMKVDGEDPSLLGKVNKRTLIFKEGTVLLSMPYMVQAEVYGILRDAYDGHVQKSFGNGVTRCYSDLHFSLLVGVTSVIYSHRDATLGERFLKFHMPNAHDHDEQIMAAVNNTTQEKEMQDALQDVVTDFLAQDVQGEGRIPTVPSWVKHRIVALSQVLAMLRATVERSKYGRDGDILFRPGHEVGTRIAKQLIKFGMSVCLVNGKRVVDYETYKLMERVAFDTGIGFHVDIVRAMMTQPNGMTRDQISAVADVPLSTLQRALEDLLALGVVLRTKDDPANTPGAFTDQDGILHVPDDGGSGRGIGRTPYLWQPSPKLSDLWSRAGVGIAPKLKTVAAVVKRPSEARNGQSRHVEPPKPSRAANGRLRPTVVEVRRG